MDDLVAVKTNKVHYPNSILTLVTVVLTCYGRKWHRVEYSVGKTIILRNIKEKNIEHLFANLWVSF